MYRIKYLKSAEDDLDYIYNYISGDNMSSALEVILHLKSTIEILRDFPNAGRVHIGNTRRFTDSKYRYNILYRLKNNTVIVRKIYKYQNY